MADMGIFVVPTLNKELFLKYLFNLLQISIACSSGTLDNVA